MSLFGNLMGSVLDNLSKQAGGMGAIAGVASSLLSNEGQIGGLSGLVDKFQQAGMGDVVSSWIGKGENLPISADQLQNVLGSDAVSSIAQKMGLNPEEALGQLSTMLPGLVDKLTPDGSAPQGGLGNMGDLAGMLGGLLSKR